MHDCPEKAPLRRPRHWPCADHVARTNASVSDVFAWLQVTRQLCKPVATRAGRHHVPAPASPWRFGDYVNATPICPKTSPPSATASRNSLPNCSGMPPTRSRQSTRTPRTSGIWKATKRVFASADGDVDRKWFRVAEVPWGIEQKARQSRLSSKSRAWAAWRKRPGGGRPCSPAMRCLLGLSSERALLLKGSVELRTTRLSPKFGSRQAWARITATRRAAVPDGVCPTSRRLPPRPPAGLSRAGCAQFWRAPGRAVHARQRPLW